MSSTNNKAIILVDGSNFYFKLKNLGFHRLLNFNFGIFSEYLTGSATLIRSSYYVGRVRQDGTEKADKMVADQQKLFAHLRSHRYTYVLGDLIKTDATYHEKGVDVQIAVDMLVATYENTCDKIMGSARLLFSVSI